MCRHSKRTLLITNRLTMARKSLCPDELGDSNFLIEECESVSVSEVLAEYRRTIKLQMLSSVFLVDGVEVSVSISRTHNGGERLWFKCPSCEARKGKLLKTPEGSLGCSSCLPVQYSSVRYKGMAEAGVKKT